MTTNDKKKVIALFMSDFEEYEADKQDIINAVNNDATLQPYDDDWNCLIPVLRRIDEVAYLADGRDSNVVGDITHAVLDYDIEESFEAAYNFIVWYYSLENN